MTSHIEASIEEGNDLFKLSDIHCLYQGRLPDLGYDITVNKTRLKKSCYIILLHSDYKAQSDEKNIVLVFPERMQQMLKDALLVRNYDDEMLMFAKVAKIWRNELFSEESKFEGDFPPGCQQERTPLTNLLTSLILYGADINGNGNIFSTMHDYFSPSSF